MNSSSGYRSYQSTRVLTANQGDLILMLYVGAISFVQQARTAIETEDLEAGNEALIRAKRIVSELLAFVDDSGGEIAVNLRSLYTYVIDRLIEANVNHSTEALDDAANVLSTLKSGWEAVSASNED